MSYLVLGAGRMARGLVHYLKTHDQDARVKVVDVSAQRAKDLATWAGGSVMAGRLDLDDRAGVRRAFEDVTVAIGAVHYRYNVMLTEEAARARTHLVDLGGNNGVVARQLALGARVKKAGVTVVPDTGLAPGMASILAMAAIEGMDRVDHLRIRVGGVPLRPLPPLGYQLVFSTEGLINEYVEDAQVLEGGKLVNVPSLTDPEPVRFPPPFGMMEAFHTSGGASTLVHTLRGRVFDLDYRTVRYPGHCERMATLKELGFMDARPVKLGKVTVSPRELTGLLLERGLPDRGEDAVLVLVTADGRSGGRHRRVRIRLVDRFDRATGLFAMMRCTAFPSACIAHMLATGIITDRGVHPQELVVPIEMFIDRMRKAGLAIRKQTAWGKRVV